jgi:hypothetical protein
MAAEALHQAELLALGMGMLLLAAAGPAAAVSAAAATTRNS